MLWRLVIPYHTKSAINWRSNPNIRCSVRGLSLCIQTPTVSPLRTEFVNSLQGLGVGDSSFSMEPTYGPCEASALKYRMKKAVALLGEAEVEKLLQEEGKIEVIFLLLPRHCSHSRLVGRRPRSTFWYKDSRSKNINMTVELVGTSTAISQAHETNHPQPIGKCKNFGLNQSQCVLERHSSYCLVC